MIRAVALTVLLAPAVVKEEPIAGGMRFDVTGQRPVQGSIRRMTTAHSAAMNGVDGRKFEAAEIDGGASLTLHAPEPSTRCAGSASSAC